MTPTYLESLQLAAEELFRLREKYVALEAENAKLWADNDKLAAALRCMTAEALARLETT